MSDMSFNIASAQVAPAHSRYQANPLSEDQKQLVADTLKQFDADALSRVDARSIVTTFHDAGIRPGTNLAEIMKDSGFDARAVGEQAGLNGARHEPQGARSGSVPVREGHGVQPPPPPPQSKAGGMKLDAESFDKLYTMLDDLYDKNLDDAAHKSAVSEIRKMFVDEDSAILDVTV